MSQDLYDLAVLERMVNGDKEFMRQMIQMFLDKVPADADRLQTAKKTKDWESVGQISHKIKSSIKMMGIHSLLERIVAIEMDAKSGNNLDQLPNKLDDFFLVLEQVMTSLKQEKI